MRMKRFTKINHWSIFRYFPSSQRRERGGKAAKKWWSTRVDPIANPGTHTTILLALIGVLLFLNFALRFPDAGGMIADYNKF